MTFESEILKPFFQNIEQFADRNAFCIADEMFTYRQLGERIEALRSVIRDNGQSNRIVGLMVNDSFDTYATIFALWAEGSAYVALHPQWPKERIDDIIFQTQLETVFDNGIPTKYEGGCPNDSGLAYIIFTSGSTGKPKGVMVGRDNVAAFVDAFFATGIIITEQDRMLQSAELSFDGSVYFYLLPVLKGACCFTIPQDEIKYQYAGRLIDEYALTIVRLVPSMLRYLQHYYEEIDMSCIRYCITASEAVPAALVEEFKKYAFNAKVYNFYGPTECTIACTNYLIGEKTHQGIVSIGKVMKNCYGIVLDENGNELPDGVTGEFCLSGPQVTRGYWNNKAQTDKSYVLRQYKGQTMRFYHTGDLVFRDSDGDYMYIGRIDHQSKIQGFRVEMSEIECHACEFLKDINVVCMAFDNEKGFTEIAMFIEAEPMDEEPLLQYLNTKMPHYMIPSRIIYVPVFPLNANAKTDRNKLKTLL